MFFEKGYDSTSISDIVTDINLAQGTFYYYFDSKQAVLESVVEEFLAQYLALAQPILNDKELDAITKWNQILRVVGSWEIENKDDLFALSRIMRMEENFRLRYKLRSALIKLFDPELVPVIVQGIDEGIFKTDYPRETTEYAFTIMTIASDACIDILINPYHYENPANLAWENICAASKGE